MYVLEGVSSPEISEQALPRGSPGEDVLEVSTPV